MSLEHLKIRFNEKMGTFLSIYTRILSKTIDTMREVVCGETNIREERTRKDD